MSDPQTALIPRDKLIADEQYQPRSDGVSTQQRNLLRESDPEDWPALLVAPIEDGTFLVLDGFGRLEESHRRNLPVLRCRIVPGGGYAEAVAANIAHGVPLPGKDRKDAARWLKETEPEMSFREIGRRCGLSDKTVAAAIREGEQAAPVRPKPDPVARFVSQIVRADDDGYATIRAVRREIECYDDDSRADIAAALAAVGSVLVEASRPFLERR